jgi:hypothetical protein
MTRIWTLREKQVRNGSWMSGDASGQLAGLRGRSPQIHAAIEEARERLFADGDPDVGETECFFGYASLHANRSPSPIGAGFVRILKHNETGRTRRTTRRREYDGILLNHWILPGMELADSVLKWTATNYADPENPTKQEFALRFAETGDDSKFRQAYGAALASNTQLLASG